MAKVKKRKIQLFLIDNEKHENGTETPRAV